MTKLMEWITGLVLIVSVWAAFWTQNIGNFAHTHPNITLLWPLVLVILFGLYSLFVIIYRVYTFNDCPEAAEELQREIAEAKEDLKSKGMKFWKCFAFVWNRVFFQQNRSSWFHQQIDEDWNDTGFKIQCSFLFQKQYFEYIVWLIYRNYKAGFTTTFRYNVTFKRLKFFLKVQTIANNKLARLLDYRRIRQEM